MDGIFRELNELKSKLDNIVKNRASVLFPSDEYDKLTDEAIDLVNQIECFANILSIHCNATYKAYQDVEIPLRIARGGKFYYGKE